jgi:hypothetical protein
MRSLPFELPDELLWGDPECAVVLKKCQVRLAGTGHLVKHYKETTLQAEWTTSSGMTDGSNIESQGIYMYKSVAKCGSLDNYVDPDVREGYIYGVCI